MQSKLYNQPSIGEVTGSPVPHHSHGGHILSGTGRSAPSRRTPSFPRFCTSLGIATKLRKGRVHNQDRLNVLRTKTMGWFNSIHSLVKVLSKPCPLAGELRAFSTGNIIPKNQQSTGFHTKKGSRAKVRTFAFLPRLNAQRAPGVSSEVVL